LGPITLSLSKQNRITSIIFFTIFGKKTGERKKKEKICSARQSWVSLQVERCVYVLVVLSCKIFGGGAVRGRTDGQLENWKSERERVSEKVRELGEEAPFD